VAAPRSSQGDSPLEDVRARPLRRIPGSQAFYPAATIYAIVVLPASVVAMLGATSAFPGLAFPAGHAHELLFGFALAVVAGNQLGPRPARTLAVLIASWLLARIAFIAAPTSIASLVLNVLFPALLAYHVAPRLVGSAKKWRNQALPAALLAICASAAVLTLTIAWPNEQRSASRASADIAVALFALLLLFMGGRLIAPTVAGQIYRQGGNLAARVQPRIEGALIVAMAIAVVALGVEALSSQRLAAAVAAVALVAAGVLALVRILRWRLWRLRKRPDLLCLAAGYAWLAAGLVLFGVTHARLHRNVVAETLAIHVITIGSLGTLTLNVMAMTRLLTLRRPPASTSWPVYATLLLAAAVALRVAGAYASSPTALVTAALCWSAAYAMLLPVLFMQKA
jgi:uncharacterized protein involved in response to NO